MILQWHAALVLAVNCSQPRPSAREHDWDGSSATHAGLAASPSWLPVLARFEEGARAFRCSLSTPVCLALLHPITQQSRGCHCDLHTQAWIRAQSLRRNSGLICLMSDETVMCCSKFIDVQPSLLTLLISNQTRCVPHICGF